MNKNDMRGNNLIDEDVVNQLYASDKSGSPENNYARNEQDNQFQPLNESEQPLCKSLTDKYSQYQIDEKYSTPSMCIVRKDSFYKFLTVGSVATVLLLIWYLFIYDSISDCPNKFVITHIWIGDLQKMPPKYAKYLDKCKQKVKLLRDQDLEKYIKKWNQAQPSHLIGPQNFPVNGTIAAKADLLRKLYLYFQSGTYADFDTEIDESCFENIITDEIIFTNNWGVQHGIKIAEQNFMRVLRKYNPSVKRFIITHLSEAHSRKDNRWNECRIKPCFIINCQKHNYDKTWT